VALRRRPLYCIGIDEKKSPIEYLFKSKFATAVKDFRGKEEILVFCSRVQMQFRAITFVLEEVSQGKT
jgi:hypothetical protein